MDTVIATMKQLEDQGRRQQATVARLQADVEAHASATARLSADNVRLSSEVLALTRTVIGLSRGQQEISKSALPQGHWVWEETETRGEALRDGRWVWSHYTAPSSSTRTGRPFASITVLPVEVFNMVLGLLGRQEQADLCRVSFWCLELAAAELYKEPLVRMGAAKRLLESRLLFDEPRSARVTAALSLRSLKLRAEGRRLAQDLSATSIAGGSNPACNALPLDKLILSVPRHSMSSLQEILCDWEHVLRALDPETFGIERESHPVWDRRWIDSPPGGSASDSWVPDFTQAWTRLNSLTFVGQLSVPLGETDPPAHVRKWLSKGSTVLSSTPVRLTGSLQVKQAGGQTVSIALRSEGLLGTWPDAGIEGLKSWDSGETPAGQTQKREVVLKLERASSY